MKRLLSILTLVMLSPLSASWAQLRPPNEAAVSLGHWHTIVRDVDAAKKFWMLFGGKPIKIDGTDVMKFPGVFVFLTKGTPSGGSVGTAVHHVGFGVPNVLELTKKLEAAGVTITRVGTSPLNGQNVGHLDTSDGLELELTQSGFEPYPPLPPNVSIESNHIHFSTGPAPESSRKEMQDWYVEHFGAKPRTLGRELTGDIPGVKFMRFGFRSESLAPTKGRALDHIGIEVKNLEAFCNKLQAAGVKFDQPYSKTRHKSFASAELTDPWGTSIELTEGLHRF